MKFYNELELGCNSVKVVDYNQDGFEEGSRQYCFPEEAGTIATREFLGTSLTDHKNIEATKNELGHVKLTDEVIAGSTSAVTSGAVCTAIKQSLSSVMTYKGSLDEYKDLEQKEPYAAVGDVWNIKSTDDNYAWNGKNWDKLAGTFDVSAAIEAHNNDVNANSAAINCAIAKHDAIEWGVHGKAFDFFKDAILGGGFETQKIGGGTVDQVTSKFNSNCNHIQLSNNDYISFVSGSCGDTSNYYLDSGCGGTGTNPAAIATRNYVDDSKTSVTEDYKCYVNSTVNTLSGCVSGLEGCVSGLEGCVSSLDGCVWNYLNYSYWYNLKNTLEDSWLPDYREGCITPYVDSCVNSVKECVCTLEGRVDVIEETTNKLEDIIYTPGSSELIDDGATKDQGGFTGWVGNPSVLGIPEGAYFDIDKITIRRDGTYNDIDVLRYLKVLVSNEAGDAWETAFFSTNAIKYSDYAYPATENKSSDITWTLENKLGHPILSKSGNVGRIIILQTTKSYDDPDETPTTVTLSAWRARTTGTTKCGFSGGSVPTDPSTNINTAEFSPSISVSYNINNFESKQDKLTAGENITIENNVISATATAAATWGSIIREPQVCVGILQSGGTRTILDSNYQTVFEINGTTSELRRKTDNGIAEIYVMDSKGTPVAASYVLNSAGTNAGRVLVKPDDVEIAGLSGSLKVSSSGITSNGLDININSKSVIRKNIDAGQFKVTHNGSNDGFVVQTVTPDGGGNIKRLEMFSTNGNNFFCYKFPELGVDETATVAMVSYVDSLETEVAGCVSDIESKVAGCITCLSTNFGNIITDLYTELSDKAETGCVEAISTKLGTKADASSVYTKTCTDSLLSAKANSADVYTKTCTDSLLSAKQDKLTAGSNITIVGNVISATGGGSGGVDTTCTAIGEGASVRDGSSVSFGMNASGSGTCAVSIGSDTLSSGSSSVAVGYCSYSIGHSTVAVGPVSSSSQQGSVAIGGWAVANTANSIILNSTSGSKTSATSGEASFSVYTCACTANLNNSSSWCTFFYNGCALSSEFACYAKASTTLSGYGITDAYTKTCTDSLLAAKATKSTTLSGYGITDAYTKTCVNTLLSAKQNTLTAGDGITISGNTISATGSSVDISGKLDKTCTQIGTDASVISELGGTGVAIGIKSYAGTFAVAIGCMATTCGISRGDIAIGGCASAITCAGSGAGTAHASIAIGTSAYAYGMCNIAIGTKAKSCVEVVDFGFGGAISIGTEANTSAVNAIAIGPQSSAVGASGIAIGCLAKAEKQTIAIGLGAQGCAHSIVLSSCFIEAGGAYSYSAKENSFNVFTGGGYTDFYVDGCSLGNELCSMNTAISSKATVSYVDTEVAKKQDKLTAGTNITIENNVISATGGGGDTSALETRIAALEAALGGYKLVALTQSEYDALTTKDENTLYFIKTA